MEDIYEDPEHPYVYEQYKPLDLFNQIGLMLDAGIIDKETYNALLSEKDPNAFNDLWNAVQEDANRWSSTGEDLNNTYALQQEAVETNPSTHGMGLGKNQKLITSYNPKDASIYDGADSIWRKPFLNNVSDAFRGAEYTNKDPRFEGINIGGIWGSDKPLEYQTEAEHYSNGQVAMDVTDMVSAMFPFSGANFGVRLATELPKDIVRWGGNVAKGVKAINGIRNVGSVATSAVNATKPFAPIRSGGMRAQMGKADGRVLRSAVNLLAPTAFNGYMGYDLGDQLGHPYIGATIGGLTGFIPGLRNSPTVKDKVSKALDQMGVWGKEFKDWAGRNKVNIGIEGMRWIPGGAYVGTDLYKRYNSNNPNNPNSNTSRRQ